MVYTAPLVDGWSAPKIQPKLLERRRPCRRQFPRQVWSYGETDEDADAEIIAWTDGMRHLDAANLLHSTFLP